MDLVSIITVNFNGYKDTCAMIDSLKEWEFFSYEIIVVDNGSECNEGTLIKESYPDITVIRSDKNLGFAGGNNLGLMNAKGNYILFLNNDIEINSPFLQFMVDSFKKDSSIGIVSPKIKYAFSRNIIQYAGFTPLSYVTLRNHIIGTGEQDKGQYDNPCYTAYAHGACMMTTRAILDEIGPMSEVFFLFYEELDWSQRVKNAGYMIWYQPIAVIYHKEGMSIQKGTPLRNYYMVRGRLLYARRNCIGLEWILSCFYQSGLGLIRALKFLLLGDIEWASSYYRALRDGLFGEK